MRAEDFMEEVKRAEAELRRLTCTQSHLRELATAISPNFSGDRVQTTVSSKVENATVALVDLAGDLNEQAQKYAALVRKANELISKIPQKNFRWILTAFYIMGWNPTAIRELMGFNDAKSVYRCRKYALRELQKLM